MMNYKSVIKKDKKRLLSNLLKLSIILVDNLLNLYIYLSNFTYFNINDRKNDPNLDLILIILLILLSNISQLIYFGMIFFFFGSDWTFSYGLIIVNEHTNYFAIFNTAALFSNCPQ